VKVILLTARVLVEGHDRMGFVYQEWIEYVIQLPLPEKLKDSDSFHWVNYELQTCQIKEKGIE
jgi:hypothetical protein